MAEKGRTRLLSPGHCSVCLPETPIVFLTGVTNSRAFAFCARCGFAWPDSPRGDFTPSDIAWLKHEIAERKAMELPGSRSYDAAHGGVSPRWPSPLERRSR